MFVIKGIHRGADVYYTGRASEGWISEDIAEAFTYETMEAAEHKAELFNRNTRLHGVYFCAKSLDEEES